MLNAYNPLNMTLCIIQKQFMYPSFVHPEFLNVARNPNNLVIIEQFTIPIRSLLLFLQTNVNGIEDKSLNKMNNNSHYAEMLVNHTNDAEIESSSPAMTLIVAVVYPLIIIFSTVGNSIVILTVVRSTAMRTITNLFISNLAASDLLMSFVAAPVTPIVFHMKNWKLPTFLCKLLPVTMGNTYVTMYMWTNYNWCMACFCSNILAIGNLYEIGIDPRNNEPSCMESWPHTLSRPIYTVVTFILQFVAPCMIISICYYRVSCVLRSRGSTKIGSGPKSREKEEVEVKRNRRTNRMLIAMVVIFVVCWIPLNVLWIVVDIIGEKAEGSVYFHHTFILCHMIAMSSAVYNPFLYAWQIETNNRMNKSKSINKPREHANCMTIADGDGGVWQGPAYNETNQEVQPYDR
ncbi:unnamed protein product [Heterobilharzia americana]|nr:unnamed protein product [Heterobilharzia americana]